MSLLFSGTPIHRSVCPCAVHMARIFVYGTLKRGQPNHYLMLDSANGKAECLASACTTQKYPLVIATKYNIPFLLNAPGEGHRVQGELYKVDEEMLKYLDAFEGVPDAYQRAPIKVEVKERLGEAEGGERLEPGGIAEAFVYTKLQNDPGWFSLPRHENYDSYGDHGLPYVLREQWKEDWRTGC